MSDDPKRTIDHKAFHQIGMTIRQGRPSPVVCPSCEVQRLRAAQSRTEGLADG